MACTNGQSFPAGIAFEMKRLRKITEHERPEGASILAPKLLEIGDKLPPFKLWRVDSMVCFGIGSVENFRSSAHIPSPCRCSEDSVEKYLAAMRVEIENDAAKQAMIRYDAICDLISCLSSIKGGSQYRAASEEDTTELINELQVTFIDPSYNPVDLAMKIAPSPSHSGGKHTQLIVNTRAISSEFNAEVFSHITRRSIVWSAASRDSFPIKEVIKREPVAIFWHDSDYKDGPGHDQECAVYHKQKAFRMGKVNVWSPYRTSAGYDGFDLSTPPAPPAHWDHFSKYTKFCLDHGDGEAPYMPNTSALYIRKDIMADGRWYIPASQKI